MAVLYTEIEIRRINLQKVASQLIVIITSCVHRKITHITLATQLQSSSLASQLSPTLVATISQSRLAVIYRYSWLASPELMERQSACLLQISVKYYLTYFTLHARLMGGICPRHSFAMPLASYTTQLQLAIAYMCQLTSYMSLCFFLFVHRSRYIGSPLWQKCFVY